MSKWRLAGWLAGIVLLATAAIAGLLAWQIGRWFESMCGTTVFQERHSPDKRLRAVVFEVDCGVGSPSNTHVSIMAGDAKFSSNRNPSFLTVHGRYPVDLVWLDSASLSVRVPPTERVYRQEQPAGVSVRFD